MFRKFGPAGLVLGLTTALVVVIFGVFALLVWQGYGTAITQARAKAQSAADVIAEETRWLVGSSLLTLKRVQFTLGGDPASLTAASKAALDEAVKSLPAPLTLSVYDAQGRLSPASAAPDLPSDISDTDLFKALAAGADRQVAPELDAAADRAPTFLIGQRLTLDGAFSGVAVITAGTAVLTDFWAPLKLGPDATVSLVREDGWIIARQPPPDKPMNIGASDNFTKYLTSDLAGSYLSGASPVDGISRIVAFRHLPDLGLIAIAAVPQNAVVGALWTSVVIVLLLLVPIGAALLGGSIWTSRILKRLQVAVDQNQVLFREIHHRVKNNLQSVSSLVRLQPIAPEIKEEMVRRIEAMSAVHEHIYRSDTFDSVAVKDYLHTLIEGLRRSYSSEAEVSERLENLTVDKDAAMPLGLIVNEVVSNAFKHAFPEGRRGAISIVLEAVGPNLGKLTIKDNGVGFDPSKQTRGMGRRLIVGLTQQLQGESSFVSEGGSLFTLTFPTVQAARAA